MATAVARQASPPNIGHPISRNSSPMDNKKKSVVKQEETQTVPTTSADTKANAASEPLAPPPRPAQGSTDTPDYFSGLHNGGNHFSLEPNPFEQSFGAPSTETPGKSLLPPVAALTSPALPGTSSASGFGWANSLRSGPLSPAMLAGPAGSGDYFDGIGRGFPTPNESSLRTGLTPGGTGSLFPAPSPNSQALFQQLQSGGATPGTLDFHRTAMNAAARTKTGQTTSTTTAEQPASLQAMDTKAAPSDPFGNHDAEAANGLFMLAKGASNSQPYATQTSSAPSMQAKSQDVKPARNDRGSIGNGGSASGDQSDSADDQGKAGARSKTKKNAKPIAAANNVRRKAEETPQKGSAKRAKANGGAAVDPTLKNEEDDDEDSDDEDGMNMVDKDGKKMTDEEKRKNFLERNRVAALKCRQRKKQWLANLQAKVEIFSSENDALSAQVTQLREEIVNLKTLLLAHKDCPISQAQGLGSYMNSMQDASAFSNPHANPYGMALQNGGMQAQMQRS